MSVLSSKSIRISGCRGVPAAHGGFETLAERLSLYLVERGVEVSVYCQEAGRGPINETQWRGVTLVHVPTPYRGALGTIHFDWRCMWHAAQHGGRILVLGYNTAAFCAIPYFRRLPIVINMDGLEWKRRKWSRMARAWLFLNERVGRWLATRLIADHPVIAEYLRDPVTRPKLTMIPYGADALSDVSIDPLKKFNLTAGSYCLVIARPEPENSILEIVSAFSRRERGMRLVVLGQYQPEINAYHQEVMDVASSEVVFVGAIYEHSVVQALRYFTVLYLHGHTVGGTNPSLVEALGAGNAIVAHDNSFNAWVAGPYARYYKTTEELGMLLDSLLNDDDCLARMRAASIARHAESFQWDAILNQYIQTIDFP
jgi:glycosyltransferase involved in cell wall biosynthesis